MNPNQVPCLCPNGCGVTLSLPTAEPLVMFACPKCNGEFAPIGRRWAEVGPPPREVVRRRLEI